MKMDDEDQDDQGEDDGDDERERGGRSSMGLEFAT